MRRKKTWVMNLGDIGHSTQTHGECSESNANNVAFHTALKVELEYRPKFIGKYKHNGKCKKK